jgi:acetyl esterase/lipase
MKISIIAAVLAGLAWALMGFANARPATASTESCVKHSSRYAYGPDTTYEVLTATWLTCRTESRWIMTFHGGSWINGDRSSARNAVTAFYGHGWQVFNVEYRHGDGFTLDDEKADTEAAYDWIVAHAKSLRIDVANGSAYGFSAGGHLAASLGNVRPLSSVVTTEGVLQPQRVVDDDDGLRESTEPPTPEMHGLRLHETALMGCEYRDPTPECEAAWNDFIPQAGINQGSAPMYMVQGDDDGEVPRATPDAYAYWLGSVGVRHEVAHVPGYGHTSGSLFGSSVLRYTVQHWMLEQY